MRSDEERRLACLKLAVESVKTPDIDKIIEAAKCFSEFVRGQLYKQPASGTDYKDSDNT